MSFRDFNEETAEERQQRRERARILTMGDRGQDGLTDQEYTLLKHLHQMSLEIERSWLVGQDGQQWLAEHVVHAKSNTNGTEKGE